MKPKCPEWLRHAVFYQIYPQSFCDTNGDGIGDIPGVIRKLDYVRSLGCNAIWLNPVFVSPFQDAGYDVADYCKVAPRYGTNADLKRLFRVARKKGIRVILDLVPGHTSIQHPWFKESCKPVRNKYWDYYIWTRDCWEQGGGVTTVNGFCDHDGNYVTNFFWCQPALNFGFAKPDPDKPWQRRSDDPAIRPVREEMKKVIRFWLDAGASGFRCDMSASLVKGKGGEKATGQFWREVRAMLDRDYPEAMLVSECSNAPLSIAGGFHVDFLLHCGFEPSVFRELVGGWGDPRFFERTGGGDPSVLRDVYADFLRRTKSKGYMAFITGNHDVFRIRKRRTIRDVELVFAFVLTMPGVPFIYYGDEIGMQYIPGLVSKEGGYDRTGSRTPMQWDSSRNAGFSAAPARSLYVPIDPDRNRPTVEAQETDPKSLLNAVRRLNALRAEHPALSADGDFRILHAKTKAYPLVYLRSSGRERFLVAINPCAKPVRVSIGAPAGTREPAGVIVLGAKVAKAGGKLTVDMAGVSYGIYRL
jgi:maltose alpha-D-glucosyltransferase/alpha-amylase